MKTTRSKREASPAAAARLARQIKRSINRPIKRSIKRTAVWKTADPIDSSFRLSGSPFYWLTRLTARYQLDMELVLKRIGMDVARCRVLIILGEVGTAGVTQIAAHSVTRLPTMTKTIQRLERDGLVVTKVGKPDGRVRDVALTEKGRDVLVEVRAQGRRVFRQAFRDIDDAGIATLLLLLTKMFANLESVPD